jgi:hypothetical protein
MGDANASLVEYSHELYVYANTLDMYMNFAPKFPGRYLSSNVNITVAGPDGTLISVPVGSQCPCLSLCDKFLKCMCNLLGRFAKFKTRK